MKLVFRKSSHQLQSLADADTQISSLKVFGQPLIARNVSVASKLLDINKIMIPKDFPDALRLVKESFPTLSVEPFQDDGKSTPAKTENIVIPQNKDFEMPITMLLCNSKNTNTYSLEPLSYPWELLSTMKKVLQEEVTQSIISPNASIAKSSIIDGPCIIEENVRIDDFCKIQGPVFIGKGSFIGMGSLIRNSMLNSDIRIGFNCEISKTYWGGSDQTAHHNVILDSVIGRNVWFGGYSGTANVLLTRKNVKYMIDEKLTDTGTDHFGALVGNNCAIGAAVIILPGRQVPANTQIQAGTIFGKNN